MDCPHCDSSNITERSDLTMRGYRRFRCRGCSRGFNERTGSLFNRVQYPNDVVGLVVLRRERYKLSLRDLADMFLEGGVVFTYEAVREWESTPAPVLSDTLRKHQRRKVGRSGFCDETYLKVKGCGVYLYWAIDQDGKLVEVGLFQHRYVFSHRNGICSTLSIP